MIGMALASELSAFAILIGYWDTNVNHAGAYITVGLVCCLLLNVVGVR
jgi:amino acid permease